MSTDRENCVYCGKILTYDNRYHPTSTQACLKCARDKINDYHFKDRAWILRSREYEASLTRANALRAKRGAYANF